MFSVEDLLAFVACLALQTGVYYYVRSTYYPGTSADPHVVVADRKSRAWFLSTQVSGIFSLLVVPLYVLPGLWRAFESTESFRVYVTSEDPLSRLLIHYFNAFLWLDAGLGYLDYPEHLRVDTTWVHHSLSTVMMFTFLGRRLSIIFLLCAPLEIPTFILSLGSMFPAYRHDLAFGGTFLAFRIVYEALLFLYLLWGHTDTVPVWLLCVTGFPTLSFHCFWFYKWLQGYTKKLANGGGEGGGGGGGGGSATGAAARVRGASLELGLKDTLGGGKDGGGGGVGEPELKVHPTPDPKVLAAVVGAKGGAGSLPGEVTKAVARTPPVKNKERQA